MKIQVKAMARKINGKTNRAARNVLNAFCERSPAARSLFIVFLSASASCRLNFSTMRRADLLLLPRREVLPSLVTVAMRSRSRLRMRSRSDDTAFMRLAKSFRSKTGIMRV
ncbi:hypothetical protein D3C86_1647440 [compost metagenome]